jgi:hypothetical protein
MCIVPAVAPAQWSDSTDVNTPVAVFPNDQEFPAAVSDAEGGVIIGWSDRRMNPSDADIYVDRLDASGISLWQAGGRLVCGAPGVQDGVAMEDDGSGGAIMAWVDRRNGSPDIYAQRVDSSGAFLWSAGGVPVTTAPGVQSRPVVVVDDSGNTIIAWEDTRSGVTDIYAQKLSAAGSQMWGAAGAEVCVAPGPQYDLTAIADGSSGAFLAWADERTGGADVYAQRLTSNGTVAWDSGGVGVVVLPDQHYRPQLLRDGDSGVYVAWVDWRSSDTELYVQRLAWDGVPQWAANGQFVHSVVQNQFAVAPDPSGGIILACTAGDGASLNVYCARINPDGTPAWTPAVALASTGDPQPVTVPLRMLPADAGRVIIVWQDSRQVPGTDLYAQMVDTAGVPLWDSAGVPVATATNFQGAQRLVTDGRGGVIVVFQDNRSGTDEDVYAQRLTADGTPASGTSLVVEAGWNLLSMPRVTASTDPDTLLPGNLGVFSFSGVVYAPADTLLPGPGFWARFSAPMIFETAGATVDSLSVPVPSGNRWVLIGGLSSPLSVELLESTPADAILQGSVYEFTGLRYEKATSILPGRAYWVFVVEPCTVNLRRP